MRDGGAVSSNDRSRDVPVLDAHLRGDNEVRILPDATFFRVIGAEVFHATNFEAPKFDSVPVGFHHPLIQ